MCVILRFVKTDGPLSGKAAGTNVYDRKEEFFMHKLVEILEKEQLRSDIPAFRVGDTVRVHVKVVEGTRERLQAFEGVVISRRHGSVRETFTVRHMSYGIGVERIFPVHSPRVDHIEVLRRGRVRRAKLFYLRGLTGKAAKIKDRKG